MSTGLLTLHSVGTGRPMSMRSKWSTVFHIPAASLPCS